jgi:hypothetical protein
MCAKILLVDDEHNMHLHRLSEELDGDIRQVVSVDQAIRECLSSDYDFVLVDLLFKFQPYELPDELIPFARELGMETKTTMKGVPFIFWLDKHLESNEGKNVSISIVSNLPKITQDYPYLQKFPKFEKVYSYDAYKKFLTELIERIS